LNLWGEGTFCRSDLTAYKFSEPSANCVPGKTLLNFLAEICDSPGRLIAATFRPADIGGVVNNLLAPFGTYMSIQRVDLENEIVWLKTYYHLLVKSSSSLQGRTLQGESANIFGYLEEHCAAWILCVFIVRAYIRNLDFGRLRTKRFLQRKRPRIGQKGKSVKSVCNQSQQTRILSARML